MRLASRLNGDGVGVERRAVVERDAVADDEGPHGEVVVRRDRLEQVRVDARRRRRATTSGSKIVRPTVEWQAAAQSISAGSHGVDVSASTA